ncbi:MAG: phosphatase PAP2 family protein [Anaerolineales bacterium]
MKPDTLEPVRPSSKTRRALRWAAHRRRPAFLLLLITGLLATLAWLPDETRSSLWAAIIAQRKLVGLLFLFSLLTMSVIWSVGERWDSRIFLLFNLRGYPKWLDYGMWLFTQLGNMLTAFTAALLFFLLSHRHLAVDIVLGTFTLWLLVETIKALAERDRPFLTLEETRIVGWREKGASFPSGHTTQIFFMATLLILRFNFGIQTALGLYVLATLVGFTRIYVGAHYPRDVFGGATLGVIWGILTLLVNPA